MCLLYWEPHDSCCSLKSQGIPRLACALVPVNRGKTNFAVYLLLLVSILLRQCLCCHLKAESLPLLKQLKAWDLVHTALTLGCCPWLLSRVSSLRLVLHQGSSAASSRLSTWWSLLMFACIKLHKHHGKGIEKLAIISYVGKTHCETECIHVHRLHTQAVVCKHRLGHSLCGMFQTSLKMKPNDVVL